MKSKRMLWRIVRHMAGSHVNVVALLKGLNQMANTTTTIKIEDVISLQYKCLNPGCNLNYPLDLSDPSWKQHCPNCDALWLTVTPDGDFYKLQALVAALNNFRGTSGAKIMHLEIAGIAP